MTRDLEITITQDDEPVTFRLVHAPDGSLERSAQGGITLVEEVLANDVAEDLEACDELIAALEAAIAGADVAGEYGTNAASIAIGPDTVMLRSHTPIDPNPGVRVPTRELLAALRAMRPLIPPPDY